MLGNGNPMSCFREKEDGWELDIRDDVLEECSKFGPIVHIHVDKNSPQVIQLIPIWVYFVHVFV